MKDEAIEKAITAMVDALTKTKGEWLASQMKRVMPPEVFALVETKKPSDRMKLARWMSENRVVLREHQPDHSKWREHWNGALKTWDGTDDPPYTQSELFLGEKRVSLLSFRIKDNKMETMTRDYPL